MSAIELLELEHLVIIQNKIDVIAKNSSNAIKHQESIREFVKGSCAERSPIIPISAQLKIGIDAVIEYLCRIPIPIRDFTSAPMMIVIRSFDINKPGEKADMVKGGVAGGTILKGVLKVNDMVEIRPGINVRTTMQKVSSKPVQARITSMQADDNHLAYAVPGGLIGVALTIDPYITSKDHLVGNMIGHPGHMPDVLTDIIIDFHLLRNLLGVKSGDGSRT